MPIYRNSLPDNTSSLRVRYSVLTVLYYLCDLVHLPSLTTCEDGAFGPCCVGNSATCSYSSGTSTGASLVGHWEGVSGGEDDLRHRHFEYNFYLSFCLRQPCNIKENINNVIYSIKKNWDI